MNTDKIINEIEPLLQEGDILFVSINSFLFKQVGKDTGSWCSHVGFAVKENNEWFVLESKVPVVTKTTLRKYVDRSCNGELAIRRVPEELHEFDIDNLKKAAQSRMGRWYNFGFVFNSKRQFCSKFVYQCYKEATGFEIGQLKTFKYLFGENPQASLPFWRLWFLGRIPWHEVTVTPTEQLYDDRLVTVYNNVD